MEYVLDTDTISYFLSGASEKVSHQFLNTSFDKLCTTSINIGEICYGLEKRFSKRSKKYKLVLNFLGLLQTVEFDYESSKIFGMLKNSLEEKGRTIADMDLMIASIAIAKELTLVTHNTKHFARVKGLKVEDWTL